MNEKKVKIYSGLKNKEECCEKPCIDVRNGEKVCLNCGMVYGIEFIQKERRAYTFDELKRRKRTQPASREFGPRTIIPSSGTDYRSRNLNAKGRTKFSRLSKIQRSLTSGIERNLWDAKPKMKLLVSKLNIPKYVFEYAWRIYTAAAKRKLTMGRSIEGFIAASLYVAIRFNEIPILLEEISDLSMVSRRTITHSLGLLIKEILPEFNINYKPIKPEQLVFKFGNELKIPIEIQKQALRLLTKSSKGGLSMIGKDPKGFAASVIYMTAKPTNHRKTQTEVSNVAKITEVTLRTRVKDIKEALN